MLAPVVVKLLDAKFREPVSDVRSRVRTCKAKSIFAHLCESGWIVEQLFDLISERRRVVRSDRGAVFQKVIGIAFFLPGYRIDDDEYQTFR